MVTLNKRSVFRFIRYSIIGISTFAFDLFLLFLLIDHFHIHYLPATALAFLVAISLNFLMSRYTVFHKTERHVVHSLFCIFCHSFGYFNHRTHASSRFGF